MNYKGFKLKNNKTRLKFKKPYTLYKSGNPYFEASGKGLIIESLGNYVIVPSSVAKEVLNPQQGTIRFDLEVRSTEGGQEALIRTDTNGATENRIYILQFGSILNFMIGDSSGDGYMNLTMGHHVIVLTWDSESAELYVDNMTTPVLTVAKPDLPTTFGNVSIGSLNGTWPGTQYACNQGISNVMFSRIKRINHLADLIDKYTTFLAPLKTDYSATVMKNLPAYIPEFTIPLANNPSCYEAWPQICALENDKLLAFYRTSDSNLHMFDPTGKVAMRTSVDNGISWTAEYRFPQVGVNLDNGSDGLCVFMNNGVETIINIFSVQNENSTIMKDYIRRSTDGGLTWSDPVLIRSDSLACGNPTELSNGDLIYGSISHNPYTGRINTEISTDKGLTWTQRQLAVDNNLLLTECSIIEVKNAGVYDGHLIAVVRSEKGTGYKIFKSADYGRTWDSGTAINGITEYIATRPSLTRWGDWLILATSDGVYQWETVLYISTDEGETWGRKYVVNSGVSARSYDDAVVFGNYVGIVWCTNLLDPLYSDVFFTRINKNQIIVG